jgi:hypothetical protein
VPGLADEIENGVAVVAAVCDDVATGRQIPQDLGHDALVMCLSCSRNNADWQTIVAHTTAWILVLSPPRERPMA